MSRDIVTAPARWQAAHWVLFLAVVGSTLLAYVEKRPIQSCMQRGDNDVERALAAFANVFGSGFAAASLWFAALVFGRLARKRTLVDAAVALGIAGIWCWILTKTGQLVLAERRPSDGGTMKLLALGGHGVSGHAAAAALFFSPVRDILVRRPAGGGRRAVTVALLAWVAWVGWSRVWLGMHFVWNVMLGLAIGFFTGSEATRSLQQDCDRDRKAE